jgi:hypothetical protein
MRERDGVYNDSGTRSKLKLEVFLIITQLLARKEGRKIMMRGSLPYICQ